MKIVGGVKEIRNKEGFKYNPTSYFGLKHKTSFEFGIKSELK